MKVSELPLPGLLLLQPDVYRDERGYFLEAYNQKKLQEHGISERFVQENQIFSRQNTIRGLHYQVGDFAQGKLVRTLTGAIIDVAVDIRFGSPTYGKHFKIELTAENNKQLWIPPGYAHGVLTVSKTSLLAYLCTAHYNLKSSRVISYNDPDLTIDWGVEKVIASQADAAGQQFRSIGKDFVYNGE